MKNVKPIHVRLRGQFKLRKNDWSETWIQEMKKALYASAVGSLMYAMIYSRPDMAYVISVISRLNLIQARSIGKQWNW